MSVDSKNNNNNRIATKSDEIAQHYDVSDLSLQVPVPGIYDSPVRYYKANKDWSVFIEGVLSLLTELPAWADANDPNHAGIQGVETFLMGLSDDLCEDIEACLPTSTTIINIAGAVSENATNIIQNTTNTTNNTATIQQIAQNAIQNGIPEPPESGAPDDLCSAAWYIEQKIYDELMRFYNDAQTVTLEEVLEARFSGGGWYANLAVLAYNWYVANYGNPNFVAYVNSARPFVREILYCAELDKDQSIDDINASADILPVAKGAYIQALRALMESKIALWAFVGGATQIGDCADYPCQPTGRIIFDLVGDYVPDGDEIAIYSGSSYWTPTSYLARFDSVYGLVSDSGTEPRAERDWTGTVQSWRVYGNKGDNSATNCRVVLGGTTMALNTAITSPGWQWTALRPAKSDSTPLSGSGLEMWWSKFGGSYNHAGYKWIDLRTV